MQFNQRQQPQQAESHDRFFQVTVKGWQLGFILLLLLSLGNPLQALSPDGQALLKFKLGIKFSDGVLANWNEGDEDPCLWPGVTCDPHTKQVIVLNLPFRKLSGYISPSLGMLTQLRRLGLHHNSLFGAIPSDLGSCKRLKALYLEVNYLSGHIPGELGQLSKLMLLDLSSNSLNGNIPASLGNLRRLSLFNVSTNFLTGEIPEGGVLSKFNGKSFIGNLKLCGLQVGAICISQLEGPTASPDTFTTPLIGLEGVPPTGLPKKSRRYSAQLLVSALGTVGVSLLVALMCFWGCFLYHKFWKKSKPHDVDAEVEIAPDPKIVFFHGDLPYTSKEIVRRIELLAEGSVIGYGGFGTVYKLVMDDGKVFAVKKIEKHNLRSDRFFERELEVLGSIKHRNLVNLRGYCNGPLARLLIYDYLPGGSLDEVLHEQNPAEATLSWAARLKIALGAAQGLAYLHHDCSPRIVHRDIKSSNILLGANLEPHVSDFGLAKLLKDSDTHVTTVVAGTFGYLAPEYLLNGRATEKADVYSYGVVLLELLSGKRPTDSSFVEKGLNIVGWVNAQKRLKDIIDPSCEDASTESLEAVLYVATMCIRSIPDERPTMHMVVKMLKAQSMSPCSSDFYESGSE
eukprot:c25284_g1_i2 orf=1009-2886(-)